MLEGLDLKATSLSDSNGSIRARSPREAPEGVDMEKQQLLLTVTRKDHGGMSKRGMWVALSYMVCAVLLVMFNKEALSSYDFPYPNIITLLQMTVSNILLFTLRSWQVISLTNETSTPIGTSSKGFPSLEALQRTSPLSISYLLYMVVGMASIRGISVPMYTTLRRTTVVFTMVMEYIIARTTQPSEIIFSVGTIVLGAVIAGARDLAFDTYGYAMVFLSNATTAVYLATIARLGKTTGLNSFGLMWCNGIMCAPVIFLWTLLSGELQAAWSFPRASEPGFQAVITMSCLLAFALNYTIFLNTALNSALTQTICGNLKDLGTVAIGWLWFQDLPFDPLNVLGQGMGFFGSGLYAYFKLKGSASSKS